MLFAFFIPTDDPEFDGLTKTGKPNLCSEISAIFFKSNSYYSKISLTYIY